MFRLGTVCLKTLAMAGLSLALSCSNNPATEHNGDADAMDTTFDGQLNDAMPADALSDLAGGPEDTDSSGVDADSVRHHQDGLTDTQGPDGDSVTEPDSGSDTTEDLGPPTLGVVSVAELEASLATKDFLLINVHVPYAGEIPKTDANLTYENIDAIAAFIGDDFEAKVIVYCLSNYMSKIAGNDLVARGYRGISYLDGGMGAWKAAGLELEFNQ